MGKPAQKIDILVANGRKHLTKSEIEARKQSEVKLGKNSLDSIEVPASVKNDVVAYNVWKSLIKEYKEAEKNNIDILSTSDVGALAEYCRTYSELERLIEKRDSKNIDIELYLKMDARIDKKRSELIKQQDRLFLNPLAKCKNVPRKEKEKPYNPMEKEYDI